MEHPNDQSNGGNHQFTQSFQIQSQIQPQNQIHNVNNPGLNQYNETESFQGNVNVNVNSKGFVAPLPYVQKSYTHEPTRVGLQQASQNDLTYGYSFF